MGLFENSDWDSSATTNKLCDNLFKGKNKKPKKKNTTKDGFIKKKKEKPINKNFTKNLKNDKKLLLKTKDVSVKTNEHVKDQISNKKLKKKKKNKISREMPLQTKVETIGHVSSIPIKKKKKRNPAKPEESGNLISEPMETNKKSSKLKQKLSVLDEKIENVKVKEIDAEVPKSKKRNKNLSLREKMMEQLKSAHFRLVNEEIYKSKGSDSMKYFQKNPEAFRAYHEGYRQQVSKWPINPIDIIIKNIKKMPTERVVADLGCGDGRLALSVPQKVHSFDLVAKQPHVTVCDMAKVPLKDGEVDVVVFCLSLMGTNLQDFILEANRILKIGGILKIAEVESRFDKVTTFIEGVQRFGFRLSSKNLSHNLFVFMDFKKEGNIKNKHKLPTISLHPCLYKKR